MGHTVYAPEMQYTRASLTDRASDQTPVLHVWTPETAPRGALVVAHGMGEHALRYARLAEAAGARGFAVFAPDHRGHGQTAPAPGILGDFGDEGWSGLIEDLRAVVAHARAAVPRGGLVLLGHSMGSMAVQHFVTESSDRIDGAALSGTTAVDLMAQAISSAGESDDGEGGDVFGAMNAAFAPTRTDFDWLSRDDAEVDRYVDDPLCGFTVAESSLAGMMEAGLAYSSPAAIERIRRDLPIYVFAGDRDPVGGNGALVRLVAERYEKAGLEDVTLRLYAEARHELFNETIREAVTAEFLEWAERFLDG